VESALETAFARFEADAAVYLAGADPFVGDRLGHLALSKAGLAERDRRVMARLRAGGIPFVVTMGGGYADDVEDIVDLHFATVAAAAACDRLKPWAGVAHPKGHARRPGHLPDARDRRE
jgi:acetoin utilization deacetylase AcuC-like enzyme